MEAGVLHFSTLIPPFKVSNSVLIQSFPFQFLQFRKFQFPIFIPQVVKGKLSFFKTALLIPFLFLNIRNPSFFVTPFFKLSPFYRKGRVWRAQIYLGGLTPFLPIYKGPLKTISFNRKQNWFLQRGRKLPGKLIGV